MIIYSKYCFFLFNLLFFINIGHSQNATFTSTASGDFDNPVGNPGSPWIITSGTDPDGIPDRADEIIINFGHTITASSSAISEVSSFTNDGTIILSSTYEFLVWGSNSAFLNAITSTNNGTISGAGILYFVTNNDLSNTGTIPSAEIKVGYGTTKLSSDLTLNGKLYLSSSGTFKVKNGNILTLNNQVVALSGTYLINEGTVIVNDSRFFNSGISSNLAFNNTSGHLIWNNSGNLTEPIGSTFKDLTISSSCSYGSDFNITGDLIVNATLTPSSAGINITFNGTSAQSISGTGILNLKKLTLNNTNGLQLSSGTINIEEVMESTSGTFTQNGANIILKSTIADNAGII